MYRPFLILTLLRGWWGRSRYYDSQKSSTISLFQKSQKYVMTFMTLIPSLLLITRLLLLLQTTNTIMLTLTLLWGWWGRCEKRKEEGRKEGRVEVKRAQRARGGRGSDPGPPAY